MFFYWKEVKQVMLIGKLTHIVSKKRCNGVIVAKI